MSIVLELLIPKRPVRRHERRERRVQRQAAGLKESDDEFSKMVADRRHSRTMLIVCKFIITLDMACAKVTAVNPRAATE